MVAVAVVVACVVVACVRVATYFLDRAREATRDRAAHSNDCARSAAMCVVVAAVAAAVAVACVAVERVRVCVCACACDGVIGLVRIITPRSSPRNSARSRYA